jgi:hypothetical protein
MLLNPSGSSWLGLGWTFTFTVDTIQLILCSSKPISLPHPLPQKRRCWIKLRLVMRKVWKLSDRGERRLCCFLAIFLRRVSYDSSLSAQIYVNSAMSWTLLKCQTIGFSILGSDSVEFSSAEEFGKALKKTTTPRVTSLSPRVFCGRIWYHRGLSFIGHIGDHDPVLWKKEVMSPEGSPSWSLK